MKKNSNKKTARRIPTKFPCIYKQTGKELYDVRYNYKETDLVTGEVRYKNKWVYGLASLEIARSTLLQLQTGSIGDGDITLAEAFELWLGNAEIRQYRDVSVQNTTGHIRITNQKGGVGKTTTTVNLGVGLAQLGFLTFLKKPVDRPVYS